MRRPAKGGTTHPTQERPGMGYGRPFRPRPGPVATPTDLVAEVERLPAGRAGDTRRRCCAVGRRPIAGDRPRPPELTGATHPPARDPARVLHAAARDRRRHDTVVRRGGARRRRSPGRRLAVPPRAPSAPVPRRPALALAGARRGPHRTLRDRFHDHDPRGVPPGGGARPPHRPGGPDLGRDGSAARTRAHHAAVRQDRRHPRPPAAVPARIRRLHRRRGMHRIGVEWAVADRHPHPGIDPRRGHRAGVDGADHAGVLGGGPGRRRWGGGSLVGAGAPVIGLVAGGPIVEAFGWRGSSWPRCHCRCRRWRWPSSCCKETPRRDREPLDLAGAADAGRPRRWPHSSR